MSVSGAGLLPLSPEEAAGPLQAHRPASIAATDKRTGNFFTKNPPVIMIILDVPWLAINYSTMFVRTQRTIFIDNILIIAPLEFIDIHRILVYSES